MHARETALSVAWSVVSRVRSDQLVEEQLKCYLGCVFCCCFWFVISLDLLDYVFSCRVLSHNVSLLLCLSVCLCLSLCQPLSPLPRPHSSLFRPPFTISFSLLSPSYIPHRRPPSPNLTLSSEVVVVVVLAVCCLQARALRNLTAVTVVVRVTTSRKAAGSAVAYRNTSMMSSISLLSR